MLVILGIAIKANTGVKAQELEPRTFANLPVGSNFLRTDYTYSSGAILADPSVRLEAGEAKVNSLVINYIRALEVAGRSAQFKFLLPYTQLSVNGTLAGQSAERNVSGVGDPLLGFSVVLSGAPALSPQEFSSYRQQLNWGVDFLVKPPLGQYDEDRLVNIGTNRWTFRTEVGLSKALDPWILEASLSASVFTENTEFLVNGTRKQDPIYALQLHAIYNFPSGIWAALSGTFYEGGDVTNRTDGRSSTSKVYATPALAPLSHFPSTRATQSDFRAVRASLRARGPNLILTPYSGRTGGKVLSHRSGPIFRQTKPVGFGDGIATRRQGRGQAVRKANKPPLSNGLFFHRADPQQRCSRDIETCGEADG